MNIWDYVIDDGAVKNMAECRGDFSTFKGNILAWTPSNWTRNGGINTTEIKYEDLCNEPAEKNFIIIPQQQSVKVSRKICEKLGKFIFWFPINYSCENVPHNLLNAFCFHSLLEVRITLWLKIIRRKRIALLKLNSQSIQANKHHLVKEMPLTWYNLAHTEKYLTISKYSKV